MTISCLLKCRIHHLITCVIKICSMVIKCLVDPVDVCYLKDSLCNMNDNQPYRDKIH